MRPSPRTDARLAHRVQFDVAEAKLRQQGARGIVIPIRDLSRTGFRAEWPHVVAVRQMFWLTLPDLTPLVASAVWTRNFELGCRFERPIDPAVFRALLARFGASQRVLG